VYCLLAVNMAYSVSCVDSNNGGDGLKIVVKIKMKKELKEFPLLL
jgi:hypothetical protein